MLTLLVFLVIAGWMAFVMVLLRPDYESVLLFSKGEWSVRNIEYKQNLRKSFENTTLYLQIADPKLGSFLIKIHGARAHDFGCYREGDRVLFEMGEKRRDVVSSRSEFRYLHLR